MSVVFDVHSHCFPPLGEDKGNMAQRLAEQQYSARVHAQGIRRTRDNAPVERPLLAGERDGVTWLPQVDFRIGRFGRLEFTHEGEDYYMQWMPPALRDMSAPPEYVVAQMDYAGVDRAVIQHDRTWGNLDDYLADAVKRYPDRLVALAQVEEWRGGEPDQIERVRRQVEELGFSGLYFSTIGFFHANFKTQVNDPGLDPLWDLAGDLGIPIYWNPGTRQRPFVDVYLDEVCQLAWWAERYPHIPSVLTHGLYNIVYDAPSLAATWPSSSIRAGVKQDRFSVPQEILMLLKLPNWHMELMLHLMNPDAEFPPHNPELHQVVRTLTEEVGADRLMWGSDMPACERKVSYQQSMLIFQTQCDFLKPEERSAILGDNLARLHPAP